MRRAAKFFLIPFLVIIVTKANANVRWSEPEVVPEKLVKKNRRVIRFSGVTSPDALVRIHKNKIKLYLDNGKTRWAQIPQKHRVQFPVKADGDGSFTFDLYLPTIPVEIPVQFNSGKRWRVSTLNFRVPESGKANEFKAIEDSFRAQKDVGRLDKGDNYYSRKNDQGMVIQDREGKKAYDNSTVEAWGGIGFSYFDATYDSASAAGSVSSSGSTLVIPAFRFGVDWDYSKKVLVKGALRSTSGETSEISGGGAPVTGRDFNWLELQASAVWFSDILKMKKGRLGFDLGFQLQQIPFFRRRQSVSNYSYFDNNTYNLHMGVFYQKKNNKVWDYDIYARYLYTLATGDAFEMDTSFPIQFEFGGGIKRRLTRGLSLGVYGQLNYFMTKVKYTNVDGVGAAYMTTADINLMLFTVDCRFIANF